MTIDEILDEAQRMPIDIWENAKPRLLRELKKEVKKKVDAKVKLIEISTRILSGYIQNPQYIINFEPKELANQSIIHAEALIELIGSK